MLNLEHSSFHTSFGISHIPASFFVISHMNILWIAFVISHMAIRYFTHGHSSFHTYTKKKSAFFTILFMRLRVLENS